MHPEIYMQVPSKEKNSQPDFWFESLGAVVTRDLLLHYIRLRLKLPLSTNIIPC